MSWIGSGDVPPASSHRHPWVLHDDGSLRPADEVSNEESTFYDAESASLVTRLIEGARPRTVSLPASLHWVEQESASGPGFVRYTPTGMVVARLLRDWQEAAARIELLGEEISTPSVYAWKDADPAFETLTKAFRDRLFMIDSGRSVLRHGADPGYLNYVRGLRLSQQHLPLRHREAGAAFRRSQHGELRGIARLNEYEMLEHHTLCGSPEQAIAEYQRQFTAQLKLHRAFTPVTVAAFRMAPESLDAALPILRSAQSLGVPVLVNFLPERTSYWSITHTLYTAGCLKTFNSQIDDTNPDRFGIRVNGARGPLSIIHTSFGSTARLMLVTVDEALQGSTVELPIWLTPVQFRVIPVAPRHIGTALAFADQATAADIRADVDDTHRSVGKRVRDAAIEWIPFIAVIGDESATDRRLTIRVRDGSTVPMSVENIASHIRRSSRGLPRAYLGHRLVSQRTPPTGR